ncbi:MAG: bifunctional rhamnulose-1-phosphate aldolase/short-chain dehydrogenase [Phycisphaera sp.]|nr:bifunctional rhamnulose-1-phosphate aldolase/short-chain dehydrogenase [Phycisphaera sp.]
MSSATLSPNPAFVRHTWIDADAAKLDPVGLLVYRSNRLGDDQRVTNTGGGNTSSKVVESDPLTGKAERVLWVKGSGGDLRTAGREFFSSLSLDKLEQLKSVYAARTPKGIKTQAEDDMVDLYRHCTWNLNPRATSIDTPLHAFVPRAHVDHTHPNALIAIAACVRGEEVMREVFGTQLRWLPWMRPGFELGLALEKLCKDHPEADGAIMGQHGLINWSDDPRACYDLTLSLISRAAEHLAAHDRGANTFGGQKVAPVSDEVRRALLVRFLPFLRGKVSTRRRMIGTVQHDDAMLSFVSSHDAARLAELGTSCPDHFLRTKIKPLFIDFDPNRESFDALCEKTEAGLAQYVKDYAAYYDACRHADSPAMRAPEPTVILVPGVGMVAWGSSKSESRTTAEFYRCAVEVMKGAESIGGYRALPRQEAFDIEYWRLEEAKLQRMPKPKPLAGHVSVIVGAGSGIGRVAASHFAADDACVACVDLDAKGAEAAAKDLEKSVGAGIGVAGSGISACGPAIALSCDAADRAAVRRMLDEVVIAYGGIDELVVTAGLFPTPGADGKTSDGDFMRAMQVNVLAPAVLVEEAAATMSAQRLACSAVVTTSVNAVVAKKGSSAYDASKAAANHLVRSLAVTFAPFVRVNAVAPATVIEGSTMFPRARVVASLKKYAIPHDESMSDAELTACLGRFYAERTLLKTVITPRDQAAAIRFLAGPESSRTTGQVLHVDGGLADAFVR